MKPTVAFGVSLAAGLAGSSRRRLVSCRLRRWPGVLSVRADRSVGGLESCRWRPTGPSVPGVLLVGADRSVGVPRVLSIAWSLADYRLDLLVGAPVIPLLAALAGPVAAPGVLSVAAPTESLLCRARFARVVAWVSARRSGFLRL